MRWGEQITLVALSEPSPRTNEHGFPVARTETATTVFADKKSVGFSEFYKAQQAGYTTELKFDVHSFEYEEQQIVEYPVSSGKRYRVLRTYTHGNGEFTELTLVNLPEAEGGRQQWRSLTLSGWTTYKKQCFGKTRSLKKPCRKCSKRVAQ